MTKIKNAIRRWYYHRLYHRLLWHYVSKYTSAETAGYEAAIAFFWLTGKEWKDVV